MVARVLGTYSRAWSQARHTVTTCAAHQIAVWGHGTTLFVLPGLGASTTTKKDAIVYLKVRLCRKRAQHIMGIPCTAPIVKKSGTKCQELKITLLEKRKIASEQRGRSVQKSVTGDMRVGALSRKVVMVWKKM